MMSILILFFLQFAQLDPSDQGKMVDGVNRLRARGCMCGDEMMPPVGPVIWNEDLYLSAKSHARYLRSKRRLTHYGKKGADISTRIARTGYKWKVVGENLGSGQESFQEVMWDWIKSPSHCKMLMNPKVEDMAVARIGDYWVQHFGKELKE